MKKIFTVFFTLVSVIAFGQASGGEALVPTEMIQVSQARLHGSKGLATNKMYYLTDDLKQGVFVYAGMANNQSLDNGGTVIVTSDLKIFKRVYNGSMDIRWFGAVPDVTVPSSGNAARGTNNTPALQRMIDAAEDGQLCMIPTGKWLFSTPLDTIKGPKRVNLMVLGDTYHNGSDFIIVANASGAVEQHNFVHMGFAIGRVNMPTHTKATHDNGTEPNWASFTGTLVKIYNTYQTNVQLNKVEGFEQPVEIIAGGGKGSQENTIAGRWFYKNANGVTLTSLDGQSYCDKNVFTGWNNGTLRISGGLGLKIDGFAGKAGNGEIYNGAFRSNEFHLMIEQVDSVAECNGDITEPEFDITVEGGVNTGVFGNTGFKMRSVAPNYVRSPKYVGQGVYGARLMQQGMGIDGTINVPVWNSSIGVYYGNYAIIDHEGNIVFERSSSLPKATRDGAPENFRFVNFGESELDVAVKSEKYTVEPNVRYVSMNNASGTVTLPAANTSVGRLITIFNDHKSAALNVANTLPGNPSVIPAGCLMTYRSNGDNWKAILNPCTSSK
jgi:hypothetical protein